MRQKNFSLLLMPLMMAFVAFMAVSCKKGYESPLDTKELHDMTFTSDQSFQVVNYEGEDMSHVTAKASEDWCVAYVMGTELRVAVNENKTYDDRSCDVYVNDLESGTSVTFKVTQQQLSVIQPEKEEYVVPVEGGKVDISLKTNVTIDYVNVDGDWMQAASTRGLRDEQYAVTVSANEDGSVRQGSVTFGNNTVGVVQQVLIRQLANTYIRLDSDMLTVGEAGGEFDINVASNVDFYAAPENNQNWLRAGTLTKLEKYKYVQKLIIDPLPADKDSRRCIVLFVKSDMTFNKMLTVEQRR
jgi:hypothetical protein